MLCYNICGGAHMDEAMRFLAFSIFSASWSSNCSGMTTSPCLETASLSSRSPFIYYRRQKAWLAYFNFPGLSTYREFVIIRGLTTGYLEDGAIAATVEVAKPELTGLALELVLQVQVPVLVITVKLQVLALSHVVNRHDAIISLHRVVLEGADSIGNHLLKVVHLMNVLGFVPDAIRLVHEDQVFVLRVHHLAHVV